MPKIKLHPRSKKELRPYTLWLFRLLTGFKKTKKSHDAPNIRALFQARWPQLPKQTLSNSLSSLKRVGVIAKAARFGQGQRYGVYRVTKRGYKIAQQLKMTMENGGSAT